MNSAKTASPEGLRPVASPAPVGELVDNPVTGERAVVRVPPQESNRHLLIADLYLRPSGAVSGEHVHPLSAEAFTVVRGQLRMRLDGRELEAAPGTRTQIPPGVAYGFWNAGDQEARVVVEIQPRGADGGPDPPPVPPRPGRRDRRQGQAEATAGRRRRSGVRR
jgi:quercetin dioxygenase-like cupin family protein